MCIVVYAADSHPTYKLILVSNRDEFLHRPTSPAAWRRSLAHPSAAAPALAVGGEGDVLCGLDAVGGGTWLGLAKDGRLGVLTNFTEPPPATPPARSRGVILADFLSTPDPASKPSPSPLAFLRDSLAPTAHAFAGFNVLLLDIFPAALSDDRSRDGVTSSTPRSRSGRQAGGITQKATSSGLVEVDYLSNRSPPLTTTAEAGPSSLPASPAPVERVTARIGGLSNSLLGDPWPKVCETELGLDSLLKEEADGRRSRSLVEGEDRMASQEEHADSGGWSEDEWIGRLERLMSHSVPIIDRSTFRSSTSIPPVRLPSPSAPTVNVRPPPDLAEPGSAADASRWYATRLTTTVLVSHNGDFVFAERDRWTLDEGGQAGQPVIAGDEQRRVFRGRLAV